MAEENVLRRFIFDELGIRGEWVQLESSWQDAKRFQQASPAVESLLGQALAAVVMLSATIKFNGSMILQAQGDGALRTLVAQATHDRKIRGLVRSAEMIDTGPLQSMFGNGRLVLTIRSDSGEPYQGIVPLEGKNLATALETYFVQSEQLKTRLWLAADERRAAGLLLQELPAQQGKARAWERIEMLAGTVTDSELLELPAESLLFRLFHEEKIRLFDAEEVEFKCACSREKIEDTLRAFSKDELDEVLREKKIIEAGCEFCNRHYRFDRTDIDNLFSKPIHPYTSETRH